MNICVMILERERNKNGSVMSEIYSKLTLRNKGYISAELQKDLSKVRVLIAGCGVGSTIAELAARMGFQNFILVDGDSVEAHNLNRQAFVMEDVGAPKVEALAKRILSINPEANVQKIKDWVTVQNVADLVSQVDLIFDTIDFLDLEAITSLHDECHSQQKPILSAVSAGWGAALVYFSNDGNSKATFRQLFGLPVQGSVAHCSYIEHFSGFFEKIAAHFDPQVIQAMASALTIMQDGKPCPAPHVAPGSYSVATLSLTAAVRLLNKEEVCEAPEMILMDLSAVCRNAVVRLGTLEHNQRTKDETLQG